VNFNTWTFSLLEVRNAFNASTTKKITSIGNGSFLAAW
jgi:hypothetical protein